jgi:hypothetical protein
MNLSSSLAVQSVALVQGRAPQRALAPATKLHPLSVMLIISLAIPEEYSFYVGNSRLTITRLLLLLSLPLLIKTYAEAIGSRFRLADILVICTGAWMLTATAAVTNFGDALAHAAPEFLEFGVSYFAFRLLTKTREQVLASLELFCLVAAIAALVGLMDSLNGYFVVHDLSATLTGYIKERQHDHRFGLLRAEGPFEHPIHLGLICCMALLIAFAAPIRRRPFCIACGVAGLLAAVSAGPIQACLCGLVLIGYSRIFARFMDRWAVFGVAALALTGAAFLISNSPLTFVSTGLTFDPGSAWSRQFEWQVAATVIQQSPWFGIALFRWPEFAKELGTFESVDSLWLALALGYGLPGSILVGASLLAAAFARIRKTTTDLASLAERKALGELLSILLLLIVFTGFTVDYWASLWVLIGVLMGLRSSPGCAG